MPSQASDRPRRPAAAFRVPVRLLVPCALVLGLLVVPGGVATARIDPGGAATGSHAGPLSGSRPAESGSQISPPTESQRTESQPTGSQRSAAKTAVPARTPAFASRVPARTSQVVRTVRSRRWCSRRWCTVTEAWRETVEGRWQKVRSFRSTIGPNGFGKSREGDMRSPSGIYRIRVTFSTGRRAPGPMPWRRRRPTSVVSSEPGRLYNTWVEQRWRSDGDRPAMRYGFIVNYNHPRLRVGGGPRPVPGRGSGIFYHTSRRGERWVPTAGCTQVGDPRAMRWIVRWLRPRAHPLVVQAR